MKKKRERVENTVFIITGIQFIIWIVFMKQANNFSPQVKTLYLINFVVLFFTALFSFVFISERINKKARGESHIEKEDSTIHDYDETIQKYLPEIKGEQELLEQLYDRFKQVEEAISKGELEVVRKMTTDDLYQSLSNEYHNYDSQGEIHVVDKIAPYAYNIQKIIEENGTLSIQMSLHVSYMDYVTDKKGEYLRGDDDHFQHVQYLLDFVINQEKNMFSGGRKFIL